jgi:hypothetical protein
LDLTVGLLTFLEPPQGQRAKEDDFSGVRRRLGFQAKAAVSRAVPHGVPKGASENMAVDVIDDISPIRNSHRLEDLL